MYSFVSVICKTSAFYSHQILVNELCVSSLTQRLSLTISLSHPPSFISVGIVRASSVFPILSTCLLMLGGLCVGVGRVYNKTNNVLLSAGILFVAAGEQKGLHLARHAPGKEQACERWASVMKDRSCMWHLFNKLHSPLTKVRISIHHMPHTQVRRTHVVKGLCGGGGPAIIV